MTTTRVSVGLIRFMAVLLIFLTAIPFFIAVNLSVFDSGWTDLSALIGYAFTVYGIYAAQVKTERWVRAR